jgi:hypothetical protein
MTNLVNNIQEKVETKISSGDINEDEFKASAMSMLSNVNGGKAPENEAELNDIMKNLINPQTPPPPTS